MRIKKPKGRRFTQEDKVLVLALYKRSPSGYRLMHSLLILPSITTVKRHCSRIELDTGINDNITKLLKETTSSMQNEKEKVSLLMWDEASLKANLWYSYEKDKIIGFEDFGRRRTSKFADHILVFMIRGLEKNTKFPLSYYFCNAQTTYAQLIECTTENVQLINGCGLELVATVCDQGSSNMKAIKELRKEYEMKCLQNNLESCN